MTFGPNVTLDQVSLAVADVWTGGHSTIDHVTTSVGNTSDDDLELHRGTWAYFDGA